MNNAQYTLTFTAVLDKDKDDSKALSEYYKDYSYSVTVDPDCDIKPIIEFCRMIPKVLTYCDDTIEKYIPEI